MCILNALELWNLNILQGNSKSQKKNHKDAGLLDGLLETEMYFTSQLEMYISL